jgi:diguanylate cyclase (GGDEF)-like protein/PAS domain S-box-containing protein
MPISLPEVQLRRAAAPMTGARVNETAPGGTSGDRMAHVPRHVARVSAREELDPATACFDFTAAIMLGLDLDGVVTMINQRGCQVLGLPKEEILGRDWVETFVPGPDREHTVAYFRDIVAEKNPRPTRHENTIQSPAGETHAIEWHNALLRDTSGAVTGLLSSGIDVTGRQHVEEELRFKSTILDKAVDSIIVHTPDGHVLYGNETAAAMRGCEREDLLRMGPFDWVAPEYAEASARAQARLVDEGAVIYESGMLTADGYVTPVEVHATTLEMANGAVVISTARDITERKQAQSVIARMAFYDQLTGLANRALFFDRLEHAMQSSRRTKTLVAVAFLDLDNFKGINDTLGHRTGDALLTDIANRLVSCVRRSDSVARLGGDEFTVLFEQVSDETEAVELADRLLACFQEPFDLGDEQIFITASIGLAVADRPEMPADEVLLHADTAMYHAKDQGRNSCQVFRPHMGESARDRFALKNDLRHAMENGELKIAYQPQFRVTDRVLVGVEALLRWNHPTRGPISPISFLRLAEESGQIRAIGAWSLQEACAQARRWDACGIPDLRMSVNLSARQFEDPHLVAVVSRVLADTGLSASRLELEVNESHDGTGLRHMFSTSERLRDLGVRLAIDDFGTGFSSLDRIMSMRVDTIKLDRRFVRRIGRDVRANAVCVAIIGLAHSLGVRVVAEGVENHEQLVFLEDQDCDEVQGYLLGMPMPAQEIALLIEELVGSGAPAANCSR